MLSLAIVLVLLYIYIYILSSHNRTNLILQSTYTDSDRVDDHFKADVATRKLPNYDTIQKGMCILSLLRDIKKQFYVDIGVLRSVLTSRLSF